MPQKRGETARGKQFRGTAELWHRRDKRVLVAKLLANGGVSPAGGKRLRVIDFRAILCEKDNAHTLWYVLGVIVQKRAERCRYSAVCLPR